MEHKHTNNTIHFHRSYLFISSPLPPSLSRVGPLPSALLPHLHREEVWWPWRPTRPAAKTAPFLFLGSTCGCLPWLATTSRFPGWLAAASLLAAAVHFLQGGAGSGTGGGAGSRARGLIACRISRSFSIQHGMYTSRISRSISDVIVM